MPEIKRLFNASRMNRDKDDRLVQPGEYREALNINVSKSEGSDMGAVENILGNKEIVTTSISNAKTIGSLRDNGNEKIYYFITNNNSYDHSNSSSKQHQIIEYDQKANKSIILVSANSLNFHTEFPITGVNLVDTLLFFTDDRNPPRKINVDTARNEPGHYNLASNVDNVISVAKFAPYEAADILALSNTDETGTIITSNFLENKLVRFSYRYQFEDGEYSVLAPFTPICFSRLGNPDSINTGSISDFGEIETFVNAVKSVQLAVSTPTGYGITGVELIYKETGSSTLYVVEEKTITTETSVNFFYKSQDPFKTLPGDQLTRISDAVPQKAKSQELAGGRLVYGNFLQNFDIPDISFSVTRTGETSARYATLDTSMSVKSRRTYQVGIVLADKFGRQSPVILSSTGNDTVFVDAATGDSTSTNVFNALRISFSAAAVTSLKALDWAYSYKIVVKQREQEYYNWISALTGGNVIARLGDSINKIPRDQTAVIPPSTSSTISPCNVSVYPKVLSGANQTSSSLIKVQSINNPSGTANVPTITDSGSAVTSGISVYETEPVESDLDIFFETSTGGLISVLNNAGATIDIRFFNCYLLNFTSGTHIEINRLRAGFNEKAFDVGVRAYVVKENFAEERRFNTLIHSSGLFNSRTNVNYINQFNEAEGGLTISLDPQDGSIQKLYADDTQIVIFQEDKLSRSPINKDFIYSAEGGAVPVTSNTQFLGTIAPYAGDFGISKDPQSFAAFGFSRYFTDKNRGCVLRLSQNGIVQISNSGMSDFFRDALAHSKEVIGSYDEYHGLYNLTIIGDCYDSETDTNIATASDGYFTISFDENAKGWPSFKSFKQENGLTLNNKYYTFNSGKLYEHNAEDVNRNSFYGVASTDSYIEPILNDSPSLVKTFNNISYEGTSGWELDFLRTDLTDIGVVPTNADCFDISLQISRANTTVGANTLITGERVARAKQGETITWAVFVEPKNANFKFNATSDVTLTYSGSQTVNIINPTTIVDGKLVFNISYTVGTSNQTIELAVGGTGASLAFTAALLSISVGDSVSNASVSPTLVELASGATSQNIVVSPTNTHFINPYNIAVGTGSLTSLNTGAITGTETIPVKVVAYSAGNKYTLDGIRQDSIALTIGKTYIFDQSDSSNSGHPLKFSTTSNGTHASGSEYTTGVTTTGTPGSSGAQTQIVVTASTTSPLYYYCTNHSGMGGNIITTSLPYTRQTDQVTYNVPVTMPSNATNENMTFSGSATTLYTLNWATPSTGTLTTPSGTSVGNAYTISPYVADSQRTATIKMNVTGTTKVMLPSSFAVSYNVENTAVTEITSFTTAYTQDYYQTQIILPKIYENTTATATITGSGEVTAAMGTIAGSHTFNNTATNANLVIGDVAGEKANIAIKATPNQNWIYLAAATTQGTAITPTTSGVVIIDPDDINIYGGNYPFTINVAANTTGSSRTGTVVIEKYNTRVTGVSSHTINITQSA
jgi:plastocyanin